MGARTRLVTDLNAKLDTTRYLVVGAAQVPEQIEPGKIAVRCWVETATHGPRMRELTLTMKLWAATPYVDDVTRREDDLDLALEDILGALMTLDPEWVHLTTANRTVWADTWHAWEFDLTAGITITTTPED